MPFESSPGPFRQAKDFLKKIPLAVRVYITFLRLKRSAVASIRSFRGTRSFPRSDFESTFRSKHDPWQYSILHQQERMQLLLKRFPAVQRALEIGCAEGMFTQLLADHAQHVIAIDISSIALQRAKKHCSEKSNIAFVQADMLKLPLQGEFDAIICAGVLVYLPELSLFEETARKIITLLRTNGILVLENMWKRSAGTMSGKRIHEYFVNSAELRMCELLVHHEYGISIFKKQQMLPK